VVNGALVTAPFLDLSGTAGPVLSGGERGLLGLAFHPDFGSNRKLYVNWNNTDNYLTTRYSEYKNFGPSSNTNTRVRWATQLSDEEAAQYTLKNIFGDWDPQKKLE
ncbi:MAG: pectinesterase family protein, partial [Bacteroidota bacterium]